MIVKIDLTNDNSYEIYIEKLKAFFHHYVPAQNVAAIIVEPVQGEGGFHVIPKKYLQELRKICTDNGIMLILDEVQTGFGRTGEWAAFHHYDIVPDLSRYYWWNIFRQCIMLCCGKCYHRLYAIY